MTEEAKDILEQCFIHIDEQFKEIHKKDHDELIRLLKPEIHKIVSAELGKKFDELYKVLFKIYENLKEKDK